jgi:hypothetical protein
VRRDKKIVGNAADIFSRRVELHQWMLAAMEYVDIPFGIYSDPATLDEIFAGWQLKEI